MTKKKKPTDKEELKKPPVYGDPEYTADEDIYSKDEKAPFDEGTDEEIKNKRLKKASTGEDLDIPGTELDDQDEEIGEEDEENNYYSLGGENHEDLEDDKGDQ